jgi:hypothetical protein
MKRSRWDLASVGLIDFGTLGTGWSSLNVNDNDLIVAYVEHVKHASR